MCQFKYYKKANPSFGDNLPSFAQGHCLPGDEAGYFCKKDGCHCYQDSAVEDCPDECSVQEYMYERCDCGKILMRNGAGIVYCPDCGTIGA